MVGTIQKAVKTGHGNAILYAGTVGLLLSDIIPTPADAIYFRLQEKNKSLLEEKKITPKQYWTRDALAYYGLNPIWWSLVLVAVVFTKGEFSHKLKVGVALVGTGTVFGVLSKNILEEEKKFKNLKK